MANTVTHIAHDHPLVLSNQSSLFTCGGCRSSDFGPRYQCSSCNFNLHELCAKLPEHISYFGHPPHQLVLTPEEVWKKWPSYKGYCDLCFEPMRGMMYRCGKCNFDLHLQCSLLPPTVTDAPAHPQHELVLAPVEYPPGVCKVCGVKIKEWNYRCASCHICIHPQCVKAGKQRGSRKITSFKVLKLMLKIGVHVTNGIFGIPIPDVFDY